MDVSVYCLNVGQGNCLAVLDPVPGGRRGEFQAALIDVGVNGGELAAWLNRFNVVSIPLIVLTHNDHDHILGLDEFVQRYRKRIGQVRFLVDREAAAIPYWVAAQEWTRQGAVASVDVLSAPKVGRPKRGDGQDLLTPPRTAYRLFCLYPTVFENLAAVRGAELAAPRTGRGPNATSAVVALATAGNLRRLRVLFGADLDFRGWRSLVESGHRLEADVLIVPHHGAPGGAHTAFRYADLARAVRPRLALFSVGTHQGYGHPRPEMVSALRAEGTTVLCTQLTRRCHDDPDAVPGRAVLPLSLLHSAIDLSPSGTACAGTVVLVFRATGHLTVLRLGEHQAAVDALHADGHHPLCRP